MANREIEEIEGIGPAYAGKFQAAGIANTDTLLEMGCTRRGRREIAQKTGLADSQILKWVNMADLFRIKGVGGEYAELLERSGVDTVKELRTRNAANLAVKLAEINEEKNLTRRTPTEASVAGWVEQAKSLPPKVEH